MIKACVIKNDIEVQAGLSLSPSEIENLTNKGRAASLGSLDGNAYYDNLPAGAEVPLEARRGTDLNTVWESSKDAQKKILDARSRAAIEKAKELKVDPKLN